MSTRENKLKIPQRNGDRALAKLIGGARPPAPAEQPGAPAPWVAPDAVNLGIQGRDGFRAVHDMTILKIPREYHRRFAALGEKGYCEAVFALRTVMWYRLKSDFPDCLFSIEIVQPRGDLCVTMDEGTGGEYLTDPRVLQGRLDDACVRFAVCLGV